jgi:hypothetical protein
MMSAREALGSVAAHPTPLIGGSSIIVFPTITIVVAIAMLPLSAGSCRHTSAVIFAIFFLLFDN